MIKSIIVIGDDSHFAQNFIEKFGKKYHIIGLGNKTVSYNIESFVHHDFDLLKNFPEQLPKADAIIHIASITDQLFCESNKEKCLDANFLKTLEFCQWAKENGVKKYIYFSTGSVYDGKDKKLTEKDECIPANFYAQTKYLAEVGILEYKKYFDIVIFRLFSPYGPKTHPDRIVNRIIKRIMDNQEIELNNDSNPRLNPLYIDDLIQAINLALNKTVNGKILNIGGNDCANIEEISKMVGLISKNEPIFRRNNKNAGNFYCSNERIKKILGFVPKTSLFDGIKKTINSYKSNY